MDIGNNDNLGGFRPALRGTIGGAVGVFVSIVVTFALAYAAGPISNYVPFSSVGLRSLLLGVLAGGFGIAVSRAFFASEDIDAVSDGLESIHRDLNTDIDRGALGDPRRMTEVLRRRVEEGEIGVTDVSTDRWLMNLSEQVADPKSALGQQLVKELEERGEGAENQENLRRTLHGVFEKVREAERLDRYEETLGKLNASAPDGGQDDDLDRDDLKQFGEDLEGELAQLSEQDAGSEMERFLDNLSKLVDREVDHHDDTNDWRFEINRIAGELGVERNVNTKRSLRQIKEIVEREEFGERTAVKAAREVETQASDTAKTLCSTLSEPSNSQAQMRDAIESAVDELDEHYKLEQQFAAVPSPSALTDRVREITETCKNIDNYFSEVVIDRLQAEESTISDDMSALRTYGADQRIEVIEDLVEGFQGRDRGATTELTERRRELRSDLESFRGKYISGPSADNYSPLIPSYFTDVVDSLLSEVSRLDEQGKQERAEGVLYAARELLSSVQSMYGDRDIQRQLKQIQQLRSPEYELVRR